MRIVKYLTLISLFLFLLPVFSHRVYAEVEKRSIRVVTIPKDSVIDENFVIKSGEVVEISGVVNGEGIVAGGQVFVDGVVNGDLIAAGGTLVIAGEVRDDLRVAGGEVAIKGTVGGNVTVFAGKVEIGESARVGGGVVAFSGDSVISGEVTRDLRVFGGSLTLTNRVGGSINAFVSTLRISSSATVIGDINYTSESEAEVDPMASVSGRLTRSLPTSFETNNLSTPQFRNMVTKIKLQVKLISFISILLIGLLMLKFLPSYVKRTSMLVGEKAWKSAGLGFLILITTPIAFIILVITLIGIPLGFILLVVYLVSLYFARIYVSYWVGITFFGKILGKRHYLPYILGLFIVFLVGFIPYLGGFLNFVILIWGLGASFFGLNEFYNSIQKNSGLSARR